MPLLPSLCQHRQHRQKTAAIVRYATLFMRTEGDDARTYTRRVFTPDFVLNSLYTFRPEALNPMVKLYDKDDPNQVKEDQTPYGDESSDDSSPAALHGRVVRLETNAQHNANKKDVAHLEGKIDEAKAASKTDTVRLEGKIDTVDAKLSGKIETVKTELIGKIQTVKTETDTKFAKVYAELAWMKKLLYVSIGMQVIDFAQDSPIIASIISVLVNLFR